MAKPVEGPQSPTIVPEHEPERSTIPASDHRMLTNEEAAAFIGRTPNWMDKARHYGHGPPFYRVGRRILYSNTDLTNWLLSRKYDSTSEY